MKSKVNVGLIGMGRLGSMYAEFISQRVPQANFVAVADLIPGLHRRPELRATVSQTVLIGLGIGCIALTRVLLGGLH